LYTSLPQILQEIEDLTGLLKEGKREKDQIWNDLFTLKQKAINFEVYEVGEDNFRCRRV
jgi:hypothetical protein